LIHRARSERILQQLVDAVRSAPIGEVVDFDQVQSCVRSALASQRFEQRRPVLRWRWVSAVAVAVSFFVGGWFGHAHHHGSANSPADERSSVQPLDGRGLIQGQDLEAGREPLIVNHPGVAKWTLAPGGKALLVSKGAHLTVQLDTGHLEANVIPSPQPESFAVEVGALRVAVHGTSFAVNKEDDSVEVVVHSGTVVVGPRGKPGHTSGTLLYAPARQRFAANAIVPTTEPARVNSVAAVESGSLQRGKFGAASAAARSSDGQASKPAVNDNVPLPERPIRVEIESAVDTVRAAAARCFADAKGGDPSHESRVMVRVDTELTVTITPSGTIGETTFVPPIPAEIQACTRGVVADFVTSPSQLGATASRAIMLTR